MATTIRTDVLIEEVSPFDSHTVDITFTAGEVYTILESLYTDTVNSPLQVLDLTTYIEQVMLDKGYPCDSADFEAKFIDGRKVVVEHEENEQYKRIVLK